MIFIWVSVLGLVTGVQIVEENLDNLAELKQENEELRQKNMQAAEHAKRILILTKSLADALRL